MMDFFYGRMRCLLKYLSLIHGSFMDDIWVQFPRFFWSGGKKKKKTFHTFRMKMKGSCEVGYWEENGGAQR